ITINKLGFLRSKYCIEFVNEFYAVGDVRFGEDILGMLIHGTFGNEQPIGHFLPAQALTEQYRYFRFPGAESVPFTIALYGISIHRYQSKAFQLRLLRSTRGNRAVEQKCAQREKADVGKQGFGQLSPPKIHHRGKECPRHDGHVSPRFFDEKVLISMLPVGKTDGTAYGDKGCQGIHRRCDIAITMCKFDIPVYRQSYQKEADIGQYQKNRHTVHSYET